MTISTPKPLTALALTQLRLDVEAAMQKAGHSLGPVDHAFFDPLEDDEDRLRSSMVKLGLEDDFDEMRSRAEARFPPSDPKEEVTAEDRYIEMNSLGMKGVIARSALWAEVADLGPARLDQFATAVGIANDIPGREMIEKIALRYARAKQIGLFEFRYWAMFAVFTLLDDGQFEQLVGVADDMGLMFASELVTALHDEPLGALMKSRAESGGVPVVGYIATPLPENKS
jgi:hypothetical protein